MILWNPTWKTIETKCGGRPFTFAPDERKKIQGIEVFQGEQGGVPVSVAYIPEEAVANHVYMKLKSYGLVMLDDELLNDDYIKNKRVEGLETWKITLNRLGANWRTHNKERESNKMSKEMPNDIVIEAAKNIKKIDEILHEVKKADYDVANEVFGLSDEVQAEKTVNELEQDVKVDDMGNFKIDGGDSILDSVPIQGEKPKKKRGRKKKVG